MTLQLMSDHATSGLQRCSYCGGLHSGMCARIKSIEYFQNGLTKLVTFHEPPSYVHLQTLANSVASADDQPQSPSIPVLGLCPACGLPGKEREKRPDGNDTCEVGHVYPSAEALKELPKWG